MSDRFYGATTLLCATALLAVVLTGSAPQINEYGEEHAKVYEHEYDHELDKTYEYEHEKKHEFNYEFFAMDTVIMLTIYSNNKSEADMAAQAAESEFRRLNDLSDRFAGENLLEPGVSDVYRVNNAGGEWVKVSQDILEMVMLAIYYGEASGGAFDIGIGAVSDLWGFRTSPRIPVDEELEGTLALGSFRDIEIDEGQGRIRIGKGAIMDLGGVAKGYATESAAGILRGMGIEHGIINAGGNVYAIGAKPDGSPWKVGIRHPRDAQGVIAIVYVKDKAVVTSGDYEKYFEVDGQRYCHILDPKTGKPVVGAASATIIDDSAFRADILSTTVFVLGRVAGEEFLNAEDGSPEALFIDYGLNVSSTEGIADSVVIVQN